MTTTAIGLVVDRSGSMAAIQGEAQAAVNEFIKEQKALDGKAFLLLTQFDSSFEVVHHLTNLKKVNADYVLKPRATTALYDAIGRTVKELEDGIEAKKTKPDQAIMVIVTDGHENASQEYNSDSLKKLIEEKQKGGWEFIFLAAGQDAILSGAQMGFAAGQSITYDTQNYGQSVAYASASVSNFRNTGNTTQVTDEDRQRLADTSSS
jgi:hypothetical protein